MDTGDWHQNQCGQYSVSMKEAYDVFLDYIPHYYEDGKPLKLMLGGFFLGNPESNQYVIAAQKCSVDKDASNYCVCGHARTSLYIIADGRMAPCMPLSGNDELMQTMPNLCNVKLSDALDDSTYLK